MKIKCISTVGGRLEPLGGFYIRLCFNVVSYPETVVTWTGSED